MKNHEQKRKTREQAMHRAQVRTRRAAETASAEYRETWKFDWDGRMTGPANVKQFYKLAVPIGSTYLRVAMSNLSSYESGNFYIKAGSASTINPICVRYYHSGVGAQCIVNNPTPGDWYVVLSPDTDIRNAPLFATLH